MGGKGSGGHNRKSAERHLREGTYRKDRHGRLPSPGMQSTWKITESLSKEMEPSVWLSHTAKRYFRELVPDLIKLGTLDTLSLRLFEGLCVALSHVEEMNFMLTREGVVLNGKPHPLYRYYNKDFEMSLKLFKVFGMTPMARFDLGLGNKKE